MRFGRWAAVGAVVVACGLAAAQQSGGAAPAAGGPKGEGVPARMVAINDTFLLNVNTVTFVQFTAREGDRGRVDIQFSNGTSTSVLVTKNEWAAAHDAILTAGK